MPAHSVVSTTKRVDDEPTTGTTTETENAVTRKCRHPLRHGELPIDRNTP